MDNTQDIGTEARILAAAEEVFMMHGYDVARMQTIAQTACINKAMLHYYFRSKEKLFEMVMVRQITSFLPEATAAFSTPMSLRERIAAFIEVYLHFLSANPRLPMFILFSLSRHPEFVKFLPRTMYDMITSYLEAEMQAGRLRRMDPGHLLISMISMCIFPFIARPMAMHMMNKTDAEYNSFLAQRKSEIMQLINTIITP